MFLLFVFFLFFCFFIHAISIIGFLFVNTQYMLTIAHLYIYIQLYIFFLTTLIFHFSFCCLFRCFVLFSTVLISIKREQELFSFFCVIQETVK